MPRQTGILSITLADNDAAGFSSVPVTTTQAFLVAETNAIRWRADGTDPTASVGVLMAVGDQLSLTGADYHDFLQNFKIVNAVAGSNGAIQGAALTGLNSA